VRTKDVVAGAEIAASLLADAFSLECWGGATFGNKICLLPLKIIFLKS
jgi:pyruvate carboxylase